MRSKLTFGDRTPKRRHSGLVPQKIARKSAPVQTGRLRPRRPRPVRGPEQLARVVPGKLPFLRKIKKVDHIAIPLPVGCRPKIKEFRIKLVIDYPIPEEIVTALVDFYDPFPAPQYRLPGFDRDAADSTDEIVKKTIEFYRLGNWLGSFGFVTADERMERQREVKETIEKYYGFEPVSTECVSKMKCFR